MLACILYEVKKRLLCVIFDLSHLRRQYFFLLRGVPPTTPDCLSSHGLHLLNHSLFRPIFLLDSLVKADLNDVKKVRKGSFI